jgi:DNA-binding LytR/AlgR family response regulator
MIRCLIADDEPLALDVLSRYIATVPSLELLASFQKPVEAFDYLQHHAVDLLFIDIKMPGITGVELIKSLHNSPEVVFTTAFREYAVEGFELQVLDYLVKPISLNRFLQTIDKYYKRGVSKEANQRSSDGHQSFIFIKDGKAMVKVPLDEILFVEALKNYVRLKTISKDIISYHSMSYMEDKLPPHQFQRIHKSFLINLNRVDRYSGDSVQIGDKMLSIGKTYQDTVLARLQKKSI